MFEQVHFVTTSYGPWYPCRGRIIWEVGVDTALTARKARATRNLLSDIGSDVSCESNYLVGKEIEMGICKKS